MKPMKNICLFISCCLSFTSFAQDITRTKVDGKIIVEGSDVYGITIYNTDSNKGTLTDAKGAFTLEVALNDLIEVRAIEYKNFDLRINQAQLDSKKLFVFLIEEIEKLDEVIIVSANKLTGDLKQDVTRSKPYVLNSNAAYFGVKKDIKDFGGNNKEQIEEIGVQSQSAQVVNSLNLTNVVDQLLIPLFRSEVPDKEAAGVPEVPAKSIKYYLGSSFLVNNFNIPEHRVEEFIRYVESKSFDFNLLNYGNELEFLAVLDKKSKEFLKN
ncbi:hypothetical protein A9Q93_07610 [Nonlabens dokdonensis]|uniref:Uncharacterized protein n=2 Tax=Nonlabens dokdonensis TaxID=328515 RepID=A0A1Z8AWQ3_9FLAO|nr:hypothetical protein A9Q93_07610 [Nonlabens dokdonensis]